MRLSPLAPSIEIPLFPSYWFIWYIFIWYLIFYIVFRFLSQNFFEIMCGIAIVLFLLFPNLQAEQSLSFIAGVLISMHKDRFCKIEKKHILTIGIGLFLFGVSILWIKQMPFIREYELESFLFKCLNLLLKLSIGMSLVLLFLCIRYKCNRYIIFCGKISYELYLVHFFFYVTIANNIQNLALFLVQSFVLAFLLFSISSNIKKRFNHKA